MSFGFSMQRWEHCFDEDALAVVRQFVARVSPSEDWDTLVRARPRPVGLSLWNDFCPYWDELLARYGVVAPCDSAHVLPVDFAGARPDAPRCVNLTPDARRAWYVVEARWVHQSWRGHADMAYAHRCRAYARCFSAWQADLQPGAIDGEIERFLDRPDTFEIVTSFLELAWVEAAGAAWEARCPVALHA